MIEIVQGGVVPSGGRCVLWLGWLEMWRKRRKTLLVAAGTLYVLFGVLAFFNIPGGHDQHHHTFAHNLTHILLGILLVTVALRSRPVVRQTLCFIFAACYFLISFVGVIEGEHTMLVIVPKVIEFHAGDYGVHLATGLFFLALGAFKRSDERMKFKRAPA
jgi:peptidoglycan/LPS O-acetylase OafA/YrhL